MKTLFKSFLLIVLFIGISPSNTISKNDKTKKQFIKVALLLGTSNSLDGLIDQAKTQLLGI